MAGMVRFTVRRLVGAVLVLLFLTLAVFVLQQIAPVDPARALVGDKASARTIAHAREELGLDQPILVQYARYVADVARGDLHESLSTRRPVSVDLREFLPATLELLAVAAVLALVLGTLFGWVTTRRRRSTGWVPVVLVGVASVPVFLTAVLGIRLFYQTLGWLPATQRSSMPFTGGTGFFLVDSLASGDPYLVGDVLRHLALPALALALAPAIAIGRAFRSSLSHVRRQDWIRTARAKGLSERQVTWRHAVRNSLNPVLSIGGLQMAYLLSVDLVVEQIFAWPGIGLYATQAISHADFPALAGVTLVAGVLFVATNTVVDVLQAWADPRIHV